MTNTTRRTLALTCALLMTCAQPVFAATNPNVSKVSPTQATVGTPVTITATYSDNVASVTSCNLYVEFEDKGVMALSGSVASLSHTFTVAAVYTVFVFCRDAAGNLAHGPNTAVVVSNPSGGGDSTSPTVGVVSPVSAQVGVSVNFQASYADNGGVTSCRLNVNGFDRGEMTLASGIASRSHTFDTAGSVPVYAQCADTSGNSGIGTPVSVSVSEAAPPPPPVPPAVQPGLVKLACAPNSDVNDPCRSVYYRSTNGTRHGFPNEKIYFTWYADFSGVTTISPSAMADLSLDANVTYRPGVRMVKFVTDPKVYAVSRAGLLRWIASESIAASLYGSDWNKKIDDLSDAFVTDYTFGPEIMKASDYSPSAATASVTSIETNF